MKFLVLAHDDPKMLARLARSLGEYEVVVHVDRRMELSEFAWHCRDLPTVRFITDRYPVRWGGFSVVEAMLALAQAAVRSAPEDEPHVYLSGHCYPIRPTADLERMISESEESVRSASFPAIDPPDSLAWRYEQQHWFDWTLGGLRDRMPAKAFAAIRHFRRRSSSRRTAPPGVDVRVGSQWQVITPFAFRTIEQELRSGKYDFLRNSFAPDEMVFQTILANTNVVDEGHTGSANRSVAEVANLHVLDSALRGSLSWEDIQEGRQRGRFFARKFYSNVDDRVLDRIDEEFLGE